MTTAKDKIDAILVKAINYGRSMENDRITAKKYPMLSHKEAVEALHSLMIGERIDGINEAHKEILEIVYTYTGGEGMENFCDVDDVSRVAMSWKVDRIKELKALQADKGESK